MGNWVRGRAAGRLAQRETGVWGVLTGALPGGWCHACFLVRLPVVRKCRGLGRALYWAGQVMESQILLQDHCRNWTGAGAGSQSS